MANTYMVKKLLLSQTHKILFALSIGMFLFFPFFSFALAGNYGAGTYNSGNYSVGEVPVSTTRSAMPLYVLQEISDRTRETQSTSIVTIPGCAVGNSFSTVTGQACPNPVVVTISGTSNIQKITKNYKFGIKNSDVKILQLFLIKENKGSSAVTLSLNGATNYFGKLTKSALAEWQKANGLTPDGVFGPKTRAKIKSLGL